VTRDPANADRTKAIGQGCQDIPHTSGLTLGFHLFNTQNGRDAVRKDDDHVVGIRTHIAQSGDNGENLALHDAP